MAGTTKTIPRKIKEDLVLKKVRLKIEKEMRKNNLSFLVVLEPRNLFTKIITKLFGRFLKVNAIVRIVKK